jgi:hypothetical protein
MGETGVTVDGTLEAKGCGTGGAAAGFPAEGLFFAPAAPVTADWVDGPDTPVVVGTYGFGVLTTVLARAGSGFF